MQLLLISYPELSIVLWLVLVVVTLLLLVCRQQRAAAVASAVLVEAGDLVAAGTTSLDLVYLVRAGQEGLGSIFLMVRVYYTRQRAVAGDTVALVAME